MDTVIPGFDVFNLIWNLFWKADLTRKHQDEEGIQSLDFLLVLYDQVTIPIQMHSQKSFLLTLMCFTRFSFVWALAFLTPYLHTHTAPLYFSQITCPCCWLLYVSFLCLSFVRSYWSTSACSPVCLGGGDTWKINKLAWTSILFRTICHRILPSRFLNRPKTALVRSRGCDPAFCFFYFLLGSQTLSHYVQQTSTRMSPTFVCPPCPTHELLTGSLSTPRRSCVHFSCCLT